jgi:NAD-dependent SIR2 family protein deacetylase
MNTANTAHDVAITAALTRAAAAVQAARREGGVVVGAGAGMGVDSGLPDFRGPEGFWKAYPPYRHLGLNFTDLANPRWFARDAAFAWGIYGHRLHLYRHTVPHAGYALLQQLCDVVGHHAVYTSNVDGAFEKAGFAADRVVAIHGSIHRLQCTQADHGVWSADEVTVDVDPDTFRARGPLPTCPTCGAVARPNILMFGDGGFVSGPTDDAEHRFTAQLNAFDASAPHVVIECGAGTHIPSIRVMSDDLLARFPHATLVRLNVREAFADDAAVAHRTISIALGAKAALQALSTMW